MEYQISEKMVTQILGDLTSIKTDIATLKSDVSWLKKLFLGGLGGSIVIAVTSTAGAIL